MKAIYNRKDIFLRQTLGNHGICVNIIHETFHRILIPFLAAEISEFFCWCCGARPVPAFLDRKQNCSFRCKTGDRKGAEGRSAFFCFISRYSAACVGIKDRDAKPHIVAGACKRFLIDVALHRYLPAGADLPALEPGIIIFHLETVVLINFPQTVIPQLHGYYFSKNSAKGGVLPFPQFYGRNFLLHHEEFLEFLRRLDLLKTNGFQVSSTRNTLGPFVFLMRLVFWNQFLFRPCTYEELPNAYGLGLHSGCSPGMRSAYAAEQLRCCSVYVPGISFPSSPLDTDFQTSCLCITKVGAAPTLEVFSGRGDHASTSTDFTSGQPGHRSSTPEYEPGYPWNGTGLRCSSTVCHTIMLFSGLQTTTILFLGTDGYDKTPRPRCRVLLFLYGSTESSWSGSEVSPPG